MFHTIVWATDASELSAAAAGFIRSVCERYDSELRIVHVAPAHGNPSDERRIAKLKALSSSLRRRGVRSSLHVLRGATGSPAPHIVQVARMAQADLVVVTTRGRAPVISAVAGSTTMALIATAPCPVLVLPAVAEEVVSSDLPVATPTLAASA